jgi:hypothetical protein
MEAKIRTQRVIAAAQTFSTPGSNGRRSFGMGIRTISVPSRRTEIPLIQKGLQDLSHWPPWCNTNLRREAEMIREFYFAHYQRIRSVVGTMATLGLAMLLSYFILLFGV